MKVRLLHTQGQGKFEETLWDKPNITADEIEVKAVMTGVCRSDIDMMNGEFGPLPLHMQGHEGLGVVTKVGANITTVNVGDFVATRGEPAYADYYNAKFREFVPVPSLDPKYIIEPVACGINVVMQPLAEIKKRSGPKKKLLILGSGFLAWVAYQTIINKFLEFDVTVVGNNNLDWWQDLIKQDYQGQYDVVIDLSSRLDVFQRDIVKPGALVVFGAQKTVTTDFANLLWKAATIVFPSPRTDGFYDCMQLAVELINKGTINVEHFWTKGYNRSDWSQAFADGVARPQGYSRGYIQWD